MYSLHVKEITVGDGEARKRYVLVYNPKEAECQREERKKLLEKLQAELDGLKQLPHEVHSKAACRLRSHPSYGKYLRHLKDGSNRGSPYGGNPGERFGTNPEIQPSSQIHIPTLLNRSYTQVYHGFMSDLFT